MLLFFSPVSSGFFADTLVKTPKGYVEIASLQVDDEVFGINKEGLISVTNVTHAVSYESKACVMISTEDEEIFVAQSQKFFLPAKYTWRKAKKLHEKDEVLAAFYKKLQVQKVELLKDPIIFYEIRLKQDHAFLITKSDIIVHNCPLFNIGILLTCGGGKIAIETVWAGVSCLVCGLVQKCVVHQKAQNSSQSPKCMVATIQFRQ